MNGTCICGNKIYAKGLCSVCYHKKYYQQPENKKRLKEWQKQYKNKHVMPITRQMKSNGNFITYEKDGIKTIVPINNKRDLRTVIKMLKELGALGTIDTNNRRDSTFDYMSVPKYFWLVVCGRDGSHVDGRFYTNENRKAAILLIKAAGVAEYHMTKTCEKGTWFFEPDRIESTDPHVFDGKHWHTVYHEPYTEEYLKRDNQQPESKQKVRERSHERYMQKKLAKQREVDATKLHIAVYHWFEANIN